jgi:hypothetical protein
LKIRNIFPSDRNISAIIQNASGAGKLTDWLPSSFTSTSNQVHHNYISVTLQPANIYTYPASYNLQYTVCVLTGVMKLEPVTSERCIFTKVVSEPTVRHFTHGLCTGICYCVGDFSCDGRIFLHQLLGQTNNHINHVKSSFYGFHRSSTFFDYNNITSLRCEDCSFFTEAEVYCFPCYSFPRIGWMLFSMNPKKSIVEQRKIDS